MYRISLIEAACSCFPRPPPRAANSARARAPMEVLVLRPLPRGELLLHLNLSVSTTSLDLRHLELFPRAMAELVLGTGVAEAHLSLASFGEPRNLSTKPP